MPVRMRDVVEWTVEDPPPELAIGRTLGGVLRTVLLLGTLGASADDSPSRPDWTLPRDPDAYVDMGPVYLTGDPAWLADAHRGRHRVAATQRDAWVVDVRGRRPATRLPLERLRITGARSSGRSRRPRSADAPWALALTDGTGPVQLDGAWLALAWLAHLAGWPEPAG